MSGWVVLTVLYFTRMLAMVAMDIALELSQCIFQLANVVSEVCPAWKGKWNWRGASLLASLAHRFFSVSFHSMKSLKDENVDWRAIPSHLLLQVSCVLQRFPIQQCPLTTQEGRAWHSRAQHETSGEKNQEAKSGHRFSAIENASASKGAYSESHRPNKFL